MSFRLVRENTNLQLFNHNYVAVSEKRTMKSTKSVLNPGKEALAKITYILYGGSAGVPSSYCIMSIKLLEGEK